MPFELFIALRYFTSRKRKTIVNRISMVSVTGIAIGSMALIIILSVYNGFNSLIFDLYGKFDPDFSIEPVKGKYFTKSDSIIFMVKSSKDVVAISRVLEDNVLVQYDEITYPARVMGVDKSWWDVTQVKSTITEGDVFTKYDSLRFCVIGHGLASNLHFGINFIYPLRFFAPQKSDGPIVSAENSFRSETLFPTGVFSIHFEIDGKYVVVPYNFVNYLLDADSGFTSLAIKIKPSANAQRTQKELQTLLGKNYLVKNRIQQHEFYYKVTQAEKWIIFAILTLIMIIASFGIVGTLMMLIIEKKEDSRTLQVLGAQQSQLKKLFLIDGFAITFVGAIIGLFMGFLVCYLQETFGIIKIGSSEALIIDTYPVKMIATDFVLVFITIITIGFVLSYYPVQYVSKKYFSSYRETE